MIIISHINIPSAESLVDWTQGILALASMGKKTSISHRPLFTRYFNSREWRHPLEAEWGFWISRLHLQPPDCSASISTVRIVLVHYSFIFCLIYTARKRSHHIHTICGKVVKSSKMLFFSTFIETVTKRSCHNLSRAFYMLQKSQWVSKIFCLN